MLFRSGSLNPTIPQNPPSPPTQPTSQAPSNLNPPIQTSDLPHSQSPQPAPTEVNSVNIQPESSQPAAVLHEKELNPITEITETTIPPEPPTIPQPQTNLVSKEPEIVDTQTPSTQPSSSKAESLAPTPDFSSLQNNQHIPDKSRFRPSVKFNIPIQSNRATSAAQPKTSEASPAVESTPVPSFAPQAEPQSEQS